MLEKYLKVLCHSLRSKNLFRNCYYKVSFQHTVFLSSYFQLNLSSHCLWPRGRNFWKLGWSKKSTALQSWHRSSSSAWLASPSSSSLSPSSSPWSGVRLQLQGHPWADEARRVAWRRCHRWRSIILFPSNILIRIIIIFLSISILIISTSLHHSVI